MPEISGYSPNLNIYFVGLFTLGDRAFGIDKQRLAYEFIWNDTDDSISFKWMVCDGFFFKINFI